jgi:hypothetical protein
MLRAIPDVTHVAELLADAVQGAVAPAAEAKKAPAVSGRAQSGESQPALVSEAA